MMVNLCVGERARSRLGEDAVAQQPLSAPVQAQSKPTEQIVEALKSDLIIVFQQEIPALSKLERNAAYEAVMNDPALLDACFRLFRNKPELFTGHVVDDQRQPVTSDDGALLCGRTLGEAVTLIVQASARRYFRRKLGATKRVAGPPKVRPGLMQRVGMALGVAAPPPPTFRKVVGAGDKLFTVIREHLLFDWQAALIPHYAPLAPEMVTQLGPRLLDIREPSELRALASREERVGMAEGKPPLLLDNAKRLIKPSGDTLDSDLLYKVCSQMDLMRLFPGRDAGKLRRAIAQVAGTTPEALEQLMPVLGGDLRLFVSFLFVAYVELGEDDYRATFGIGGATGWMVKRYADRLAQLGGLPPPAFEAIRDTFEAVVKPGK